MRSSFMKNANSEMCQSFKIVRINMGKKYNISKTVKNISIDRKPQMQQNLEFYDLLHTRAT